MVDEIWIPLGESLTIAKFSPLWNLVVEGFSRHNPYEGLPASAGCRLKAEGGRSTGDLQVRVSGTKRTSGHLRIG